MKQFKITAYYTSNKHIDCQLDDLLMFEMDREDYSNPDQEVGAPYVVLINLTDAEVERILEEFPGRDVTVERA